MNLIDEFITRYRKEYDFFDQAARLGAQMLDAQLRAAGIRSIVSSRAKAIERLQTKVQKGPLQDKRNHGNRMNVWKRFSAMSST